MRNLRVGLFLAIVGTLASCSDPAAEQPVSLKPGLYRVTMDREAFGPVKVSYDPNSVEERCIAGDNGIEWIYPMIQRKFCPECSCSTTDKTRTGNAITARAVCPLDDQGIFGAFEYTYQGVVSEDGVALTGKVKTGLATIIAPDASEAEKEAAKAANDSETIAMSGRVERVGDCPG